MKNKYLTTEVPLDQPEEINYTGDSKRRDGKQADDTHIRMKEYSKQKWDQALWNRSYKESETEWRNRLDDYKSGLVQETFHLDQQSQDDEQCS